jgi:outer membrane scaffolding protein for murein synthesis (MipA/OmpV family)
MGRFEHFLPNRYSGVGDVPATLEGGFRTGFSFLGIVNFSISAAGDILGRGHGGLHGEGAMALQLPLHEIGLFAAFEVAVMAGDASYMDSLYGVDAGQARSSAFEAYKAKGGVEATRGAVTMRKRMGEHWSIIGKIGMMRLAGSLEESPLVEEKQQYSLQLLTAYRF